MIAETLKLEEIKFRKTLASGIKLLDDASNNLRKGDTLAGDVAFKLYDTYGFPLDLTQDALRPRGIAVDLPRPSTPPMAKQKDAARAAWKGSGEAATEGVWFEVKEQAGATEFLGYEAEQAEAIVKGIYVKGKAVKALAKGETGEIVVNQTPFYGESGGQVGDTGVIKGANGALFRVTDTQKKLGDLFVHIGTVEAGSFKSGDAVDMVVDHGAPHGHPRQPFGDAPDPRGVAPGARHARAAEGLARERRAAALRRLAQQADGGGGDGQGRGDRQRGRRARTARSPRA